MSRETVNVPVGSVGRPIGVDASGTASGSLDMIVAVTVAIGALFEHVSSSNNQVARLILP